MSASDHRGPSRYVLGIDLGVASVGWAAVDVDETGRPTGARRLGVRIFEPGMTGSVERGLDESRNLKRRQARLQRRQLRRRAARRRDLFRLLVASGLLPQPPAVELEMQARHDCLQALDGELRTKWLQRAAGPSVDHLLPYLLRARALDERLEPYEIGRLLYQMIQRRGFKSNRKEGRKAKADDETGKVKAGIAELDRQMKAAGAPTLGAYFSGLDPHQWQAVRRRWTKRDMFTFEFERIWTAQARFHPDLLTPERKDLVCHLLFDQRPIAAQKHLIGKCELEPGEIRAPWASLPAQRFRMLQKLNDLRIEDGWQRRDLSPEERATVLGLLEKGDQTYKAIRKALGIGSKPRFNFQKGLRKPEEARIPGERLAAILGQAFGSRWATLEPEERDRVVDLWRDEEDGTRLQERLIAEWGLSPKGADVLAGFEPEDGYCNLSLNAIGKLLPEMEAGAAVMTAIQTVYPVAGAEVGLHRLRPVIQSLPEIRNPSVLRSLSELRKVINAVVREFGKPWQIRVELARDLKRGREERHRLYEANEERRKQREKVREQLISDGVTRPGPADIERIRLHAECGGICPYTGRPIGREQLFSGEIEVDHILPISLFPDDSFANKVVCYRSANQSKGQRTPRQAFEGEEYEQVLMRVKSWPQPSRAKLERFELADDKLSEFTERQLNDTRYASRLAMRYLGQIYGDAEVLRPDGTRRAAVAASSGMVTATLRRHWCLEKLLGSGEGGIKQRLDHRHHAVDALVIACTSQAVIQNMSRAAAVAAAGTGEGGIRSTRAIASPWPDFVDSVVPMLAATLPSHRPNHKLSGALHEETNYSEPRQENGRSIASCRKPVQSLTEGEIKGIVDPAVRAAVIEKLAANGGKCASFKSDKPETLPSLTNRSGVSTLIRRVRIAKAITPTPIGDGPRKRFVEVGDIHHVELFVRHDGRREYWDSRVVSLLDAMERKSSRQPIVNRVWPGEPDTEFLFSLMKGDLVEMQLPNGQRGLALVNFFYTNGQIFFADCKDARQSAELRSAKAQWSKKPNTLKADQPRKVVVTPAGEVLESHD